MTWLEVVLAVVAVTIAIIAAYRLGLRTGISRGTPIGYEEGYHDGFGVAKDPTKHRHLIAARIHRSLDELEATNTGDQHEHPHLQT